MKKITAIIRTDCLEPVERALRTLGVEGISVSRVNGYGEHAHFANNDWLCTHARIETCTEEAFTQDIVDTIMDAAHTGRAGDGIVAVLPVERFFKVREQRDG